MEKERMRHAVPLTPFQEKLYEVVINAFRRDIHEKFLPPIRPKVEEEVSDRPVVDTPITAHEYYITTPKWKEKGVYILECLIGIIEDHISFLFILTVNMNLIWLQLMSIWVIPKQNEELQSIVFILKVFFIIIILLYVMKQAVKKTVNAWHSLKARAEMS